VIADPIDDLLADLIKPALAPRPAPTPAKAANPANREHPCGLTPDLAPCEGLRKPANRPARRSGTVSDSQPFADLRYAADALESEQTCGFSQDSQDSQGSPATSPSRTCADCLHLLTRGTCAEPVAAGLLTEAEGFSIVWPADGHAANCHGFTDKTPGKAQDRPYKVTPGDADTCHAGGWYDAEIAQFQARAAALRRRGIAGDDADDLAERLTLRDRERDTRVLCAECSHYRPGRCGNHKAAGLLSMEVGRDMAARLQRCPGFSGEFASKEKT